MNQNEEKLLNIIRDRFEHCESSGRLIYKKWFNGLPKNRVGTVAGSVNERGYPIIRIEGVPYREHQLVWLLYNKELIIGNVEECIDHIDRNPTNNKIQNLRKVSQRENSLNTGTVSNSGYNNIYITPSGTYFVRFSYGSKKVGLWTHKTIEKTREVVDTLMMLGNTYENALLVREKFKKGNKYGM